MFRIATTILLLFILNSALGQQEKKKSPFRIEPSFAFGFLEGESETSVLLQVIPSVKYKTYSAGIGVGLDYYVLRSIPVFFDFKKQLFDRSKTPFLYSSIGTNFPWIVQRDGVRSDNVSSTNGLFYDLGAGYRFKIDRNDALFFSLGYTYKAAKTEISQPTVCISWPCPEQREKLDYALRRWAVKVGFSF